MAESNSELESHYELLARTPIGCSSKTCGVRVTDSANGPERMTSTFTTGTEVWWRSIVDERVGYTFPTTVLIDNDTCVALLQRHGCVCKRRRGRRTGPQGRVLPPSEWDGGHQDRIWDGPDSIRLWPVGTLFTVIRSWHSERESPEGWYVNLERPWIRRKHGFDTSDLALDIEVEDDLSHWTLKDEDELDVAREAGVLDADDVDAVKREANRVGRLIDERRWPFRTDAEVWRALSEAGQWPIAKLPAGWDLAPPSSVP
jgi:hypothetical protein